MKNLLLSLGIVTLCILNFGCKKSLAFKTGVHGKVYYGEGEYGVVEALKKYEPYNGDICVIPLRDHKRILELGEIGWEAFTDSMLANSKIVKVTDGNISIPLDPDTFIVNLCAERLYDEKNVVYVEQNQVIFRDFYLFNYTSVGSIK